MSCLSRNWSIYRKSLVFVVLLLSLPAFAQVVTADFEDGTTDGFTGFGGASVAVSTDVANTGTHSLVTTNRTQTYMGPGIDLSSVLTAGQPYLFKIAVRLSSNTPSTGDTVNVTMKSTIGGTTNYSTVASSGAVTDTGWTILQGTYAPPTNFTPPPSGADDLFLYVEDDTNASAEYYVDTFSVSTTNGGCTVPP